MIIVDVDILVYHEVDGPMTPLVKQLAALDSEWVTSSYWKFEFSNVLATMVRAKLVTLADAEK